jgi:hypothetical protein
LFLGRLLHHLLLLLEQLLLLVKHLLLLVCLLLDRVSRVGCPGFADVLGARRDGSYQRKDGQVSCAPSLHL